MRKPGIYAGLVALAVGAAACGGSSGGGTNASGNNGGSSKSFTMTIGDLVPQTGDLSQFGPPGAFAAKLAAEQLNQALKNAGSGITIKVNDADTQTESTAAVSAARKLISDGASCMAGAWASSDTIPVGKSVASRENVPLISPASTSAQITSLADNGYVFRTAPSDILQGQALAQVVAKDLGGASGKKVSFAARNDAYGSGFLDVAKKAWEAMGGTATGTVLYDPQAASYDSEASKIVSGNPDAYVIIDFPETYAKMGAALLRTGKFDAKKMYTADGLASSEIPKGIPAAALQGANGTRPGTPTQNQTVTAFDDLYKQQNGPTRASYEPQNFDAVMLCGLAAIAAGSNKGSDVQAKLQAVSGPPGTQYDFTQLDQAVKDLLAGKDIDYQGVSGPIDFDSNGDPSAAYYEVWKYGSDSKLSVVRTFQASSVSGGGAAGGSAAPSASSSS